MQQGEDGVQHQLESPEAPSENEPPAVANVVYDYIAKSSEEVSVQSGAVVNVLSRNTSRHGWWQVDANGDTGIVPSNVLNLVEEASKDEKIDKVQRKLMAYGVQRAGMGALFMGGMPALKKAKSEAKEQKEVSPPQSPKHAQAALPVTQQEVKERREEVEAPSAPSLPEIPSSGLNMPELADPVQVVPEETTAASPKRALASTEELPKPTRMSPLNSRSSSLDPEPEVAGSPPSAKRKIPAGARAIPGMGFAPVPAGLRSNRSSVRSSIHESDPGSPIRRKTLESADQAPLSSPNSDAVPHSKTGVQVPVKREVTEAVKEGEGSPIEEAPKADVLLVDKAIHEPPPIKPRDPNRASQRLESLRDSQETARSPVGSPKEELAEEPLVQPKPQPSEPSPTRASPKLPSRPSTPSPTDDIAKDAIGSHIRKESATSSEERIQVDACSNVESDGNASSDGASQRKRLAHPAAKRPVLKKRAPANIKNLDQVSGSTETEVSWRLCSSRRKLVRASRGGANT